MFSENHPIFRKADGFRRHNFVGFPIAQHSVLMNAGFMRKRVFSCNRFVRLNLDAGKHHEQLAGVDDLRRVDPGICSVKIVSCFQIHDDFFQSRISRALSDSVKRAFRLPCPGLDRSQSQIVVAMHGDERIAKINMLLQISNDFFHFFRLGISDGVRNIDHGSARVNCDLKDLGQKRKLASCGVLRGKFHCSA